MCRRAFQDGGTDGHPFGIEPVGHAVADSRKVQRHAVLLNRFPCLGTVIHIEAPRFTEIQIPANVDRHVREYFLKGMQKLYGIAVPVDYPENNQFSIVQLTDTHIGPLLKKEWLQQVVDTTNSVSPDLIVLTGDYIDGTVEALAEEVTPFAELRAKHGVYGVTGNHEYYWGAEDWSSLLEKLHVTMLRNEHRVLSIGNDRLVIAGMPDRTERRFGGEGPDIKATLQDAPEVPRILLEHQPRDAAAYAPYADVHLSGHTHGGLMSFLQPIIAGFNNSFAAGAYAVNGMHLYVSPGTGLWSGFSCRIGVPSEITRLVLRAG